MRSHPQAGQRQTRGEWSPSYQTSPNWEWWHFCPFEWHPLTCVRSQEEVLLSKPWVISVLHMLTVQPVVPWPLALIMIRRELNYLGYLCRGKCFGRAAAMRRRPGGVMCSSVVLPLQDDSAICTEKWQSCDKNVWFLILYLTKKAKQCNRIRKMWAISIHFCIYIYRNPNI